MIIAWAIFVISHDLENTHIMPLHASHMNFIHQLYTYCWFYMITQKKHTPDVLLWFGKFSSCNQTPQCFRKIVGDLRIHWDGSGGDLGMQCPGGKGVSLLLIWGEGSLSHDLSIGFIHFRWFSRRISEPSTVCPSKSCSFEVYAWVLAYPW